MQSTPILDRALSEGWSDGEIVNRVCGGETALYEILIRRYNQRLYRVARAILRDDTETEDVMQDAFVRAFQNLRQFKGLSPFSAWLTRIAVHEALARLRFRRRMQQFDGIDEEEEFEAPLMNHSLDPEQQTSQLETRLLLEEALLALPAHYRAVLMLRDVEDLSTAETADALELTEQNVKVRLHRGRSLLRRHLMERFGSDAKEVFAFMGTRCDRVAAGVLRKISQM